MKHAARASHRQRGISFIGLLFVAGVLACVGVVGGAGDSRR